LKFLDFTDALSGIAGNDIIGITFFREGTHANDTLSDVLHVLGARFKYV